MLEFRTLGGISFRAGGKDAPTLLAHPRKIALLSYIAASRDGTARSRDSLIALFWPEHDEGHARAALRQVIHALREHLGHDAFLTQGDQSVSVDPTQLWCDAATLENFLATHRYEEVLSLYHGEFLEGFHVSAASEFEEWVDVRRDELHRMARTAAETLVKRGLAEGTPDGVAAWARRLVQLAPDEEEPVHYLIVSLLKRGDRVGALSAFDRYAHRVAGVYGIDPSPSLCDLVREFRRQPPRHPFASHPRTNASVKRS